MAKLELPAGVRYVLVMPDQLTIGELAADAGIRTSTIRFYERRGLLSPDARSAGNYRLYGKDCVERLRFIRAAQATGFTLHDIDRLLSFHDGEVGACADVQSLIEQRLADVRQRMKDLRHVDAVLTKSLALCRRSKSTKRCQLLDALRVASPAVSGKRRASSARG